MSSALQQTTELLTSAITSDRCRAWGISYGLSILDQGLTSGAGFLLNLMLARWLSSESYGAFAVAFATLLFLSGYHNVLLLEPMTVLGPARYSTEMRAYLFAQLKINAVVVASLSGLMLFAAGVMALFGGQHDLIAATAASGLALPFLLLFWLVRRMCYAMQRPAIAARSSAGYLAILLVGIFAAHSMNRLSSGEGFLLMAAASVLAVSLPLWELGLLRIGGIGTVSWKKVAAENWNYGRWLMASTTLFSVSSQAQTYLVAAMIGLAAAGTLRAMQIPALVMTQIVTATALLMLPSMSYEFGKGRTDELRKKAMLSSLGLTGMALAYALLLGLFAKPLEHILFGGKFAEFAWLIPVSGLVPVCTGFLMGFSMALRASQKPQFELLANGVGAPIGLITALIFIKMWGIGGAAFSLVAGYAAVGVVVCWSFARLTRFGKGASEGVGGMLASLRISKTPTEAVASDAPEELRNLLQPVELNPLTENPLISVLVANFNYDEYIGQAIESVLGQSYANFELIVCDDGSTDQSCDVVLQYMARDSRIRLLRQPNSGQASALNTAYRASRGEIICLLDADDRYLPGKLETVVGCFQAHPDSGFLVHKIFQMDREGRRHGILPPLWDPPSGWFGESVLLTGDPPRGLVPTSALCMRKRVADLIFPLPETLKLGADAALCCLASLMTRLLGVPVALAEYRYHDRNGFAPSRVDVHFLRLQLEFYGGSWRAQQEYLGRIHPRLAEAFPPLDERLAFLVANYVLARLSKEGGTIHAYQGLTKNARFSSSPFLLKSFWAASILLPLPIFRRAVDWVWADMRQGSLKRFIVKMVRFFHGSGSRTSGPDSSASTTIGVNIPSGVSIERQ